jgi:hypothetical protein
VLVGPIVLAVPSQGSNRSTSRDHAADVTELLKVARVAPDQDLLLILLLLVVIDINTIGLVIILIILFVLPTIIIFIIRTVIILNLNSRGRVCWIVCRLFSFTILLSDYISNIFCRLLIGEVLVLTIFIDDVTHLILASFITHVLSTL